MNNSKTPLARLAVVALVVGTVQGFLYAYTARVLPDQIQLLWRGFQFSVLGKWTHFGNALTGGGFNPGSLTTLLIGLPLWLWDSPWSYEVSITALHLLGLWLFYQALEDEFSPPERLAFVALIWLTPWRASFTFLWNPSYLFFLAGLHFYTAVKLSQRPGFWMTFLHVVTIGAAMQIHASFVVLVFLTAYLVARRKISLDLRGFMVAAAACALSLLPYLEQVRALPALTTARNDDPQGQHFYMFRGLVEVVPLLKGIFYWPRFTSAFFPNHIFNMVDFDFVRNPTLRRTLAVAFLIVRYVVGLISMVLSLAAFWSLLKRIYAARPQKFLLPSFLDNYAMGALIAMTIASAISPIIFSNWHLLLVMPIANIQLIRFVFRDMSQVDWFKGFEPQRVVITACAYFAVYNLVAVCVADSRSFRDNIHDHFQELKIELSK